MKKIIGLAVVLSLFCCLNVFAEDKNQSKENNEEISKEEIQQAGKYVDQMTSFAATFMNSFKNFFDQDEKQDMVNIEETLENLDVSQDKSKVYTK